MSEESTTPDLVELTRRAIESVGHRDLDAGMSMYGPDSVWDVSAMGIGVYTGVARIRREMESWIGAFGNLEVQIEEIPDLGNETTFSVVAQSGCPVGSSGKVHMRFASITQWADQIIVRVTAYTNIDEARAAAERLAEERV
ncbi:MAG TPA: nuclear transport factor 2 family protein [Solirubrobacteraceae bacterium]|nr:nuclear transport factor 2 family protein [Solirubrobacteraceae bacterium]